MWCWDEDSVFRLQCDIFSFKVLLIRFKTAKCSFSFTINKNVSMAEPARGLRLAVVDVWNGLELSGIAGQRAEGNITLFLQEGCLQTEVWRLLMMLSGSYHCQTKLWKPKCPPGCMVVQKAGLQCFKKPCAWAVSWMTGCHCAACLTGKRFSGTALVIKLSVVWVFVWFFFFHLKEISLEHYHAWL